MNKIALISVSDKTNIDLLASKLVENGYTIISTGGTANYLQEKGIKIKEEIGKKTDTKKRRNKKRG